MKLLILGSFKVELMKQVLQIMNPELRWVIVTNTNKADWESATQHKIMLPRDFKNGMFEACVLDSLKHDYSEQLGVAAHWIVICNDPLAIFPWQKSATEIVLVKTKSEKLLEFHKLFFSHLDVDTFKSQVRANTYLRLDVASKEMKSCSTLTPSRASDLDAILEGPNPEQMSKELQTMCKIPLIQTMLKSANHIMEPGKLRVHFSIRKKRLDLFGMLLLNMLRSLKDNKLATSATVTV